MYLSTRMCFDREEALEAALNKRTFLLKPQLKHNTFSKNDENNTLKYSFYLCCVVIRIEH